MEQLQEQYNRNTANTANTTSDETEIDLKELVGAILSKWYWIFLVAVLFGGAAFTFFKFFVAPTYQSKAQIYVVGKTQSGTLTYSDLQLGSQLSKDYVVLAKSRSVVETVISEMGLNMTYGTFLNNLSVATVADSRMMSITYTDTNPYLAKDIADKICEVVMVRIQEVMQVDSVKVVDAANLPKRPVGPQTLRNTLLAAFLGAFLVMGIITVRFLLDDRIKTSEDVERYLGISVLGTIPLNSAKDRGRREKTGKKSKKTKK